MGHSSEQHAPQVLDLTTAEAVASTMQAFATASRVRILGALRVEPRAVNDLAKVVEMDASTVSHQLRILRQLGLVTAQRTGRTALYSLHDAHVARLLDEAVGHLAHTRLGSN